jgi:outer membrane lipoprotein SlyB
MRIRRWSLLTPTLLLMALLIAACGTTTTSGSALTRPSATSTSLVSTGKTVSVPDVSGDQMDQAVNAVQQAGLGIPPFRGGIA